MASTAGSLPLVLLVKESYNRANLDAAWEQEHADRETGNETEDKTGNHQENGAVEVC